MKKFWIVLLSLLLSLACVMGFAACTERPDEEPGGTVQPGDPDKPHEHDFGEWTVTVPATCTEAGEEQRTCACGEVEIQEIAPLGHIFGEGEVTASATCTQTGVMTYTCECCGETKTETIAMAEHTVVIDAAVAPTCVETGLTEGSHCSVCHTILIEQRTISALWHNFGEWEVILPATCTELGEKQRTCSECGETEMRDIYMVEHTFSAWEEIAPATCTKSGMEMSICTVCGMARVHILAALGHTEAIDEAVAPTCTETGLTEGKHCSVCNVVLVEQEVIVLLGHDWDEGEVTMPATCGQAGVKIFTCERCGETRTELISALEHRFADGVCTICGSGQFRQFVLEAERTDLEGLQGAGFSGNTIGVGLICQDYDENHDNKGDFGASGGYYVDFMYRKGFTLTFEFDSDRTVDDAVLILRISNGVSWTDSPIELTDDDYLIQVNDEKVAYDGISLPAVPLGGQRLLFSDAVRIEGIHLKAGHNTIKLITNNEIGLGGTAFATAPIVDCIKIQNESGAELDNTAYDIENFPPLYQ